MLEISVYELEPYVSIIHQLNDQLTETLWQLKRNMLYLENCWSGAASQTFREKTFLLDQKIELYQALIQNYANHLDSILQQYILTEQNLQRNANDF